MKRTFTLLVSSLFLLAGTACQKYITYEQFGAKGDGVTDDMPAIIAAHQAANEKGLPVKAKAGSGRSLPLRHGLQCNAFRRHGQKWQTLDPCSQSGGLPRAGIQAAGITVYSETGRIE